MGKLGKLFAGLVLEREEDFVLALAGSARANGNTETLLDAAIEGVRSAGMGVEKYRLSEMNITGCTSCGSCLTTGQCVLQDEMTRTMYNRLETARHIILASPIYFMGMAWPAKLFIDRCQPFWVRKFIRKTRVGPTSVERRGLLISASGTHLPKTFDGTIVVARCFMVTIDVKYGQELLVPNCDEKGLAAANEALMDTARQYGYNLVAS